MTTKKTGRCRGNGNRPQSTRSTDSSTSQQSGCGRSRFNNAWSPGYAEAVAALRRLLVTEGLNTAMRAAGDALSEPIRRAFVRRVGLVLANGAGDARLLRSGPQQVAQRLELAKGEAYRQRGERRVDLVIGQPYSIEWGALQVLVDRCRELGLEARVTGESWHFPAWSVLVEVRRKGDGDAMRGIAGVT